MATETNTLTTKESKAVKLANVFIKIAIVLIVLLALAIGGIFVYDVLGMGMSYDEFCIHLSQLCSKTYVWLSSTIVAIGGIASYITVNIGTIISNSTNFILKVQTLNKKVDNLTSTFKDLFKTYRNVYEKKLSALEEQNLLLGEIVNLLLDSCLDPDVKEKGASILTRVNECTQAGQEVDEELKKLIEESKGE